MSPQRVVILRQKGMERYLPVWVGPNEAESITIALQEVELSRPMTHDLLKNALTLFDTSIQRAEIVALKEDVFYGNLVLEREGKTFHLDSRPSDAIALAVRAHVPILVSVEVMNEAGIVPEKDLESEPTDSLSPDQPSGTEAESDFTPKETPPEDKKRLDVFEDFLKNLGHDKSDEDKKQ